MADSPKNFTSSKIFFAFITEFFDETQNKFIQLDDTTQYQKPMELIIGNDFILPIWEESLLLMLENNDQHCSFSTDLDNFKFQNYLKISKTIRDREQGVEQKREHKCVMSAMAEFQAKKEQEQKQKQAEQQKQSGEQNQRSNQTDCLENPEKPYKYGCHDCSSSHSQPSNSQDFLKNLQNNFSIYQDLNSYHEMLQNEEKSVLHSKQASKLYQFRFNFQILKLESPNDYKKESWQMKDSVERMKFIQKFHAEGNLGFKKGEYEAALDNYSRCIDLYREINLEYLPGSSEAKELTLKSVAVTLNYCQCLINLASQKNSTRDRFRDLSTVIDLTTELIQDRKILDNPKIFYKRAKANVLLVNETAVAKDLAKILELDASLAKSCNFLKKELKQLCQERDNCLKGKLKF